MGEDTKNLVRVQLLLDRGSSAWLDEVAVAIRQATGAAVNRSAIVRAALRAAKELDPARFKPENEGQLAALLIAVLRRGRQAMGW